MGWRAAHPAAPRSGCYSLYVVASGNSLIFLSFDFPHTVDSDLHSDPHSARPQAAAPLDPAQSHFSLLLYGHTSKGSSSRHTGSHPFFRGIHGSQPCHTAHPGHSASSPSRPLLRGLHPRGRYILALGWVRPRSSLGPRILRPPPFPPWAFILTRLSAYAHEFCYLCCGVAGY